MEKLTQTIDYRSLGQTGLKRFSGFIYEQFLRELSGWRGVAVYQEMSENDPVIGSFLGAIDKLCRRVPWRVDPASSEPYDKEAAVFLEQCMNDMEMAWIDIISEFMSMITFGHSVHEIVYKRRCGKSHDRSMNSKYVDGRIGWRGLPIRSQDTLYRWRFDEHGTILGVEQLSPPTYMNVFIPWDKMLLFRTSVYKNNPEGRSALRNAYRPWYLKKNIENIEGIGVERDLAGLPIAYVPPELLSEGASQSQKALLAEIKKIVTNVRRDEQEGIVFPAAYDQSGKPLFEFKLLTTGGSRQLDTDKIIQRYDQRIAMTALADFMLLGSNSTGSFALSSDKTKLFAMAIGAYLDIICDTLNRFAVPRLFELNDMQVSEYPKIVHGDMESIDLNVLGDFITKITSAGMPLFPDDNVEKYLRQVAGLPEALIGAVEEQQRVEPQHLEKPTEIIEIPDTVKAPKEEVQAPVAPPPTVW